jgi:hypothetical protein
MWGGLSGCSRLLGRLSGHHNPPESRLKGGCWQDCQPHKEKGIPGVRGDDRPDFQEIRVTIVRMTPEEHLDRIQHTLDYVATLQRSHDEQIAKLVEQSDRNEKGLGVLTDSLGVLTDRLSVLTERTIQAMDAINRLARIAANHEDRIDNLESSGQ